MSKPTRTVVNLGNFEQLRKPGAYAAGNRVLEECRDIAMERLQQYLARMLEKVDDALFARAEKAENNVIQTRYFDAMRELRIIRKDIEEEFLVNFKAGFHDGLRRNAAPTGGASFERDSDGGVGLVRHDDLEEELAINNMVVKLRGICSKSLYALDKRIGLLLRDPGLEQWLNPLGPEAVCNAFKAAAQRIETGIEIRLVVYKLFDQYVVNQIDLLYREINTHLVSRGVMPEIKTTVRGKPDG